MSTKEVTGFPSIDKPWLKYYTEEAKQATNEKIDSRFRKIKFFYNKFREKTKEDV